MQREGASPGAQPAQACESSVEIPEIRECGVKGEGQTAGGYPLSSSYGGGMSSSGSSGSLLPTRETGVSLSWFWLG